MSTFLSQGGSFLPSFMMLFFIVIFIGILFWAFRPANKSYFEKQALIPLQEDEHDKS